MGAKRCIQKIAIPGPNKNMKTEADSDENGEYNDVIDILKVVKVINGGGTERL